MNVQGILNPQITFRFRVYSAVNLRCWRQLGMVFLLLTTLAISSQAQGTSRVKVGVQAAFKALKDGFHPYPKVQVVVVGADTQVEAYKEPPFNCSLILTTDKAYGWLKPDRTYQVIFGYDICEAAIVFDVPEGYDLYIDGVKTNTIYEFWGVPISNQQVRDIVLREKCSSCGAMEGGGESSGPVLDSEGNIIWGVGLGKLSDGRSAEGISLRGNISEIYKPAALIYSRPINSYPEVEIVRVDSDGRVTQPGDTLNSDPTWNSPYGILRQVKTPQTFADVVVINESEYDVRFYHPAAVGGKVDDLYTFTGQPFATWKIKNLNEANPRVQILKTQNGTTDTTEYAWDAAALSWSLSQGGGASFETKTSSVNPTDPNERTELSINKNINAQVTSKHANTYRRFPWGEELIQQVNDPDGAALTTTYVYYQDASETGRYGKLQSVSFPNGSWEKYDYDSFGNRTLLLRPWKDQTLADASEYTSHTTVYTYTANDGVTSLPFPKLISSIAEYADNSQIKYTTINRAGTTVNGHTAVVETRTVYASASSSLTTKTATYYSTATPALIDRVAYIEYPDGRRDTYNYEKGDYATNIDPALNQFTPNAGGAAERVTVVHGTVSAPAGVPFKTTKDATVHDQAGNAVLEETYVYNGTGYERVAWAASSYNERGQLTQTTRHNGQVSSSVWVGDRQQAEINDAGIETDYTYDAIGRISTMTKKGVPASGGFPAQPDIVTTFTYDPEGRKLSEIVASAGLSLSQSWVYDRAGRLQSATDQAGLTTSHAYANGGRTQTITLPGGATQVIEQFIDGRTKSTSGTAVVSKHFDYGVNPDGTTYTQEFTGAGGLSSPRWTKTTTDWLGRNLKVETPGFTGTNLIHSWSYNPSGLLQRERATFGIGAVKLQADKLYEYDELGKVTRVGADVDDSGTLSPISTDRLIETSSVYEKNGSDWFLATTRKIYVNKNDATATTQTEKERLTNFPSSGTEKTVTETTTIDVGGNQSQTTTTIDRQAKKVITKTDVSGSNIDATSISVNSLTQSATPAIPRGATTYTYDTLGRPTSVNEPGVGTNTKSYNPATGQLLSINDGVQTTSYEYYPATHPNAGRLKAQTNSAGKKIYFAYNSRGELTQTWGDATYPTEYVYDTYGQQTELHTFRAGSGWGAAAWPSATTGAADVTKRLYHEPTGLLTEKQDAAIKGTAYTYDILGRLQTRRWSRTEAGGNQITTTYTYDAKTGDMAVVNYSDGTPQVKFSRDRAGRVATISDAAGSHTLTYNAAGEMQTTQTLGGLLDGVALNVGYDAHLRRQSLQVKLNAATLSSQTYGYDSASRLQTITNGSQTATYAYDPTKGLLNATTFTGGTAISRAYDAVGRLDSITTTPAAGSAQSYTYTYNNLNQRTRVTREEGSYWAYQYNDRGELIFGKRYWADTTPMAGQQQEYVYDNIGNRSTTLSGGDGDGTGLRSASYTTNALNQYAQRTVPGAVDILGSADAAATVTVNGQATYRRGGYFQKALSFDNAAGPVYAQVDIVGVKQGAGMNGEDAVSRQSGNVFLSKSVEASTYDVDGNLTSDGRWTYTWDAENRLTSMTTLASVPNGAKRRLEFAYDWMGRRIQKKVYGWNAQLASYQLQTATKFVYDGWNIVAELDGNNTLVRNYVWGQDMSGLSNDAGGIGGLLLINDGGNTYHVGYDGNGNVGAIVKSNTGTISASYEYDPFGKTLRVTGEYATRNPFRFSTKYTDEESGLIYYGYRYYNPQTGKWISKDPIGEAGGLNLYGFVVNSPLINIDPLGDETRAYWDLRARQRINFQRGINALDLNRRITEAYASMYKSNPRVFVWAGMAAFASELIGQGMKRAVALREAAGTLFGGVAMVAGAPTGTELLEFLKAGNVGVYADIYWQHMAYSEKGMAEIKLQYDRKDLPHYLYTAWCHINSGDIQHVPSYIWKGNSMLLQYEQRETLQRYYNQHQQAIKWMSNKGNVENWPLVGMPVFASPIPGDSVTFYQFNPTGNLANFDDRWRWIEESISPAWRKLSEQNPRHVMTLIDRLIEQGKQ
jgi:RHS repeat-associated protein